MPLYLTLATEADIPLLVPAQYAAFHPNDTFHRLLYPSPVPVPESIIKSTIERHLENWGKDRQHVTWLVVKDSDVKIKDPNGEETDRVAAAAKWIIWQPSEEESKEERWPLDDQVETPWILPNPNPITPNVSPNGAADDAEYVAWLMKQVFRRKRENIRGPAALLDLLFTDPEYHRRGAGKMLVEWGTGRADELGVKAWVEASAMGRGLYESCGFRGLEDVSMDGGKERDEWKKYGTVDYSFMGRGVGGSRRE